MSAPIIPTSQERPFEHRELFFSTTDRKGIIRTGNDVFVRVSAHPFNELVGSPHNIIRHPDMPRAVFKLLWDTIAADRPFAGYVKNMAADGGFYWVVALIVPIADGYLSVRLKPSSSLFPVARDLYAELLAVERSAGTAGGAWREGMARAGERLQAAVRGLGYAGYDEFMHTMLATELSSHRALLDCSRDGRGLAPALSEARLDEVRRLLHACGGLDAQLAQLFSRVEGFLSIIRTIDGKARFLANLSSNVHLVALNAVIASCRLQQGGEGFSVVTQDLARLSAQNTGTIHGMTGHLTELSASLRQSAFSITAANLQVEMTIFFLRELLAGTRTADPGEAARIRHDVAMLLGSLAHSAEALREAVPRVQRPIPFLRRLQDVLGADLRRLASTRLIGKIQAVGINEEGHFLELLDRVLNEHQKGAQELEELGDGIARLARELPILENAAGTLHDSVSTCMPDAAAA